LLLIVPYRHGRSSGKKAESASLRRFPSFSAGPLAVSGFIPFGELLAVFREGEEEAVST
jgi:hypothetical protein